MAECRQSPSVLPDPVGLLTEPDGGQKLDSGRVFGIFLSHADVHFSTKKPGNRARHITTRIGAGTNFKVGRGHTAGPGNFLVMPLHFFGSTTIGPTNRPSRFVERFRDGQYSLVSFLFAVLLLTVSP